MEAVWKQLGPDGSIAHDCLGPAPFAAEALRPLFVLRISIIVLFMIIIIITRFHHHEEEYNHFDHCCCHGCHHVYNHQIQMLTEVYEIREYLVGS